MKTIIIFSVVFAMNVVLAPLFINAKPGNEDDTIVNGYVIFPDFKFIVEQQEYKCYGVPIGHYEYYKCSLCGEWYVTQPFGKNGVKECDLYAYSKCKDEKSNTKYHDNLDLDGIGFCLCTTILMTNNKKK